MRLEEREASQTYYFTMAALYRLLKVFIKVDLRAAGHWNQYWDRMKNDNDSE